MHPALRSIIAATGLITPVLTLAQPAQWESKDYEPLEIHRKVTLAFPSELKLNGVNEGEVCILIWVNQEGQLLDWMLEGASHALLAKEVLDALPQWKFKPARFQGQPIPARVQLLFQFQSAEAIRVITDMGIIARMNEAKGPRKMSRSIYAVGELDQPLDPVVEIAPRPPDQFGATVKEGAVVVDYLIDTNGKVRMPIIISSDDQAFTTSVLLAVLECRYAVPQRIGVPVITRVRQKFAFTPVNS
ncbi:MAG: energy transducer TonB [bacterium]|nr:energy transducer TonB [bacterium]MDI1335210.1 energy transducer TonB [Lacunisphaera sp.]